MHFALEFTNPHINGLLSWFMFFYINTTPEWLDGFDSYGSDKPLEETFDALGAQ